jgi:hypothetical protein
MDSEHKPSQQSDHRLNHHQQTFFYSTLVTNTFGKRFMHMENTISNFPQSLSIGTNANIKAYIMDIFQEQPIKSCNASQPCVRMSQFTKMLLRSCKASRGKIPKPRECTPPAREICCPTTSGSGDDPSRLRRVLLTLFVLVPDSFFFSLWNSFLLVTIGSSLTFGFNRSLLTHFSLEGEYWNTWTIDILYSIYRSLFTYAPDAHAALGAFDINLTPFRHVPVFQDKTLLL